MSRMRKKLAFVLAAVFSILVAGATLPGCDNGKPSDQQQAPD
jgi:hypothetical protein